MVESKKLLFSTPLKKIRTLKTPSLRFRCAYLLAALLTLLACSCKQAPQDIQKRTQVVMGTLAEISVRESDREKARIAIDSAFAEMRRIENLMSAHIADSEVSRLNKSAGEDFMPVSPEMAEVIRVAIRVGDLSQGAFDITIGPVVNLWKFDDEHPSIPAVDVLKKAVELVNYKDMEIKEGKIRLTRAGMQLHLGAIAKGYGVDRAIGVLRKSGIRDAIVNAGGDLMATGTRNVEKLWVIGIQHPRKPENIIASFAVKDRAVATSGDYQKYFIRDNIRYHHIFNPADGTPASGVTSVTIAANTAMEADALATAVFVLGAEKGLRLIESLENTEAMIVSEDGSTRFSKGFKTQPGFKLQ